MKKDCVIIAGGDVREQIVIPEQAFVICADCGYRHALAQNIQPDLLVGDFDSYEEPIPETVQVIRYPAEKDVSDTWAAFTAGAKRGCQNFLIYGAFGGERIDHAYANIQLLHHIAEEHLEGCLFYQNQKVTVFIGKPEKKLLISGKFSLFSLTEQCTGMTIRGAKYHLQNHVLKQTFPLCLSNETEKQAEITVQQGTLLVFTENLSHLS